MFVHISASLKCLTKVLFQQYFEIRSRNINKLRESHDPVPYPHKFSVNTNLEDFVATYGNLKSGETRKDVSIRAAGRIYNKRSSGPKLVFYDIRSEGVKMQIMCQSQEATEGGVPFEKQHEHLRRGDIVGVIGFPGRTSPKNKLGKGEDGELSIFAKEVILLTPCLHQLPDEYCQFSCVNDLAN
jgi:lysyl-tRNA synthetase, class II